MRDDAALADREYLIAQELIHLRKQYHALAFSERSERVLTDYTERQLWSVKEGGKYDL